MTDDEPKETSTHLTDSLKQELDLKNRESKQAPEMIMLLTILTNLGTGGTSLKNKLREYITKNIRGFKNLNYERLKIAYEDLSMKVTQHYIEKIGNSGEIKRTLHEQLFDRMFRGVTRRNYMVAYWYGNHNLDGFILAKSGAFKGVAIEIDGSVHLEELKMKKDSQKDEYLLKQKVAVIHIDNEAVNSAMTKETIKHLASWSSLDSRDKRNLLTRIFIQTIAHMHARVKPDAIHELLGVDDSDIRNLIGIIKRHKAKGTKRSGKGISL